MRVALGTSWTVSFSVCIFLLSSFNLFVCANLELFLFLWWELLSQGPLNFPLSKTLEWLVLYCMEHANLWQPKQSWINLGRTADKAYSTDTCAIDTKTKGRPYSLNYERCILIRETRACFVLYTSPLHQKEFLPPSFPRMEVSRLLWDSVRQEDFFGSRNANNIFLVWSPCIQHPGAWFLFIKRKPVLFFIPITCCYKWLKSFKDSKCWKTAVCWCEQHV